MTDTLYLAWRYLAYHKVKTGILVSSIALIVYLPVGLSVLVDQSADGLLARAAATPLVVGARGSPLELVLNSLYFDSETPQLASHAEVTRIAESDLAVPIPLYVRFRARGHPIVGTTVDYFDFRGLRLAGGRPMAMLGECVVGSAAAAGLGVGAGGSVISTPESVFDLAGTYPLKMTVAGVLEPSFSPDDQAIFVDLKTAWVIEGLVHGHQDLTRPEAAAAVLERDGDAITANASVVQYNEITAENLASFHLHGDPRAYPISAVVALPKSEKSAVILMGRYQGEEETAQIVRPVAVVEELLGTVFTVRGFVIAALGLVALATAATAVLVFLLSLRLRRREIDTMEKIGGSRLQVAAILSAEVVVVLLSGGVLAAGMTLLTSRFGEAAVRAFLLS